MCQTPLRKQTQITVIRHEPSYKQLEVKTNRTSFLCGNQRCGTGTTYPSGAPAFTPGFQWGLFCSIFSVLCVVLQTTVCPIVFFPLSIVLSVLSSIYCFWLPLQYLQFSCNEIVLCLLLFIITCRRSHVMMDKGPGIYNELNGETLNHW